jgi:hypothetical protein
MVVFLLTLLGGFIITTRKSRRGDGGSANSRAMGTNGTEIVGCVHFLPSST